MSEMGSDKPRQVLSGLRILDLSRWVAGEYATKILADFGAEVVKVEKPGEGSFTRHWGPFPNDIKDINASGLYLHLNTNKRSIELDLKDPADRDRFLALVAASDAIVESFRAGALERLGLTPESLLAIQPRLVVARISSFGQTGPYRDYEATGLVLQATGGPMHSSGMTDRPPLKKPGLVEQFSIGRSAGAAILAGIIAARRSGKGSVIDISGQEVLLSGADRRASYLLTASYSGSNAPRGVRSAHRDPARSDAGPYRAADGFVMAYAARPSFLNDLIKIIAADDKEVFDRLYDRELSVEDKQLFTETMQAWCLARSKREIMEICESAHVPVTAVLRIDEVLDDPHYRSRGAFVAVDHPVAGRHDYPGAPWRMRHGFAVHTSAPILGQHNQDYGPDDLARERRA